MHCGKPPQLGPATGSAIQGETKVPLVPITPKAELHYKLETTKLYPCYCIRDIQSLKDKQIECNVHQRTSRATLIKELTLQINNNLQHDTSIFIAKSKSP